MTPTWLPRLRRKWARDLTGFLTQTIFARLRDIGDAGAIRAYLDCMQQDDADSPGGFTNTPQVFLTKPGSVPLAWSAMLIMRGGTGIPGTLPLVRCFAKVGGNWTLIPNDNEHGFDNHQLYVDELRSPVPDESWYLLSGKVPGQGQIFRMEVVACSARRMRTVWQRDDILNGRVEVYGKSTVSLAYEKQEDERTAAINGDVLGRASIIMVGPDSSYPKLFFETLHVTSNGLEQ